MISPLVLLERCARNGRHGKRCCSDYFIHPRVVACSMRIAHVALKHMPLDVRVFYKEARTLARAGHDVHVITGDSSVSARENVTFHSVPGPIARTSLPAPIRQLATLAAYLRSTMAILSVASRLHADAYHLHEPWLIPLALLLKLRGARVVYDAHEDHRDVARRLQQTNPVRGQILRAWFLALENLAEHCFDRVVVATPAIARRFRRPLILHNYPLLTEMAPRASWGYESRPLRVIATGGISEIRGGRELVRAIDHLQSSIGVRLILVGRFTPASWEGELRKESGWQHVEFHPWTSRDGVQDLLAQSRAGLVVFHPVPNHTEALPNKLFEYMAAGIPVIASAFPLWRSIIGRSRCGILVDPTSPSAIANAIRWILEHPNEAADMGRRGQEAVLRTYNWDSEAAKLVQFYQEDLSDSAFAGLVARAPDAS